MNLRISLNHIPEGSCIGFSDLDQSHTVYILTARHCLAEKVEDPLPDLSSVTFEWFNPETITFINLPFSSPESHYVDLGNDLLFIMVRATGDYWPSTSTIILGRSLINSYDSCFFTGFPVIVDQERPITVKAPIVDKNAILFEIETTTEFESNLGDFASENTQGFSGSGVFIHRHNQLCLVGIVLRYHAGLRRFTSVNIDAFIHHAQKQTYKIPQILTSQEVEPNIAVWEDISSLRYISTTDSRRINDRIGDVRLTRNILDDVTPSLLQSCQAWIIWGQAGRGKSVVGKQLLIRYQEQGCETILLSADRLTNLTWSDALNKLNIKTLWERLISSNALTKPVVIMIDGVEKLLESPATSSLTDLLLSLENQPNLKVVLTCRAYRLSNLLLELHHLLPSERMLLEVPQLTDDNLEQVARRYSVINPLLTNSRIRELLHTPFYLDQLVRYIDVSQVSSSINENQLRTLLWERVIERGSLLRGEVMTDLVIRRARQMTPFAQATVHFDEVQQLLKTEVLIADPQQTNWVVSAHDIFEDWALNRYIQNLYRQQLTANQFINEIGTAPALRRGYRQWLLDQLVNNEQVDELYQFVQSILNDESLPDFWRDETLTALLRSPNSRQFWNEQIGWLSQNDFQGLWLILRLLKTACQEPDEETLKNNPPKTLETPFRAAYLRPVGIGWEIAIQFIYQHYEQLIEHRIQIQRFLSEEWQMKLFKQLPLPVEAHQVGELLFRWIHEDLEDAENVDSSQFGENVQLSMRLAKLFPEKFTQLLKNRIDEPNPTDENSNWRIKRLKNTLDEYALGWKYSIELCRTIPEVVIELAIHRWFFFKRVDNVNAWYYDQDELYGINNSNPFRYYPASAYQTPLIYVLRAKPNHGFEIINTLLDHAINQFIRNCPRNNNIETVKYSLDNQVYEQQGSVDFWRIYRGVGTDSNLLKSALMALERYLLELVKLDNEIVDQNLDFIYTSFLTNNKCVAVTAVLVSIATAYPARIGKRVLPILTVRQFYKWDLERMAYESHSLAILSQDNVHIQPERFEMNQLPHRERHLEDLVIFLQLIGYRQEIQTILDDFSLSVNPQDTEWRLALNRMDLRHNKIIVEKKDDKLILQTEAQLAPDLNQHVKQSTEEFKPITSRITIFNWAIKILGQSDKLENNYKEWSDFYDSTSILIPVLNDTSILQVPANAALGLVGLRDYSSQLTAKQRRWCIEIVIKQAQKDLADPAHPSGLITGDILSVLPLLLNQEDVTQEEQKIVRELIFRSLVHIHDNPLVVPKLVEGVQKNLWKTDESFANACVAGLIKLKEDSVLLFRPNGMPRSHEQVEVHIEEIIQTVLTVGLTLEADQISNSVGIGIAYLSRALAIINPSTTDSALVSIFKQAISLYDFHLQQPARRRSRIWENEVELIEGPILTEFEIQLSQWLYFQTTELSQSSLYKILISASDRKAISDSRESIKRLAVELILIENKVNMGKLWPLWNTLSVVIRTMPAQYLLRYLFLRISDTALSWNIDVESWPSITGKKELYSDWFKEFAYKDLKLSLPLLTDLGLSELMPNGIIWVSKILNDHPAEVDNQFDKRLKYHFEKLVERAFYKYKLNISVSKELKQSYLNILDFLVKKESSVAFAIREIVISF